MSFTSQQCTKAHDLSLNMSESSLNAAFQILLASLFIACCTEIRIPLYFTPIPLSGSTCAIMFVGLFLGSRKGALAVICYLVERFIGMPLWDGNCAHFFTLFNASGGYRLAWVLQAFLVGWYFERSMLRNARAIFVLLLVCGIQLGIGTLWLGCFAGFNNAMTLGFYPFIPGEFLKVCMVALYLKPKKGN
ncbi:MAG TPA: biotin transporter BioY [Rhabdochlamydiaceae bacterium]